MEPGLMWALVDLGKMRLHVPCLFQTCETDNIIKATTKEQQDNHQLKQYDRTKTMLATSPELRPGYAPAYNNPSLVFVAECHWSSSVTYLCEHQPVPEETTGVAGGHQIRREKVFLIWGEIPIEPFLSLWKESEKLDSDVGCVLEESVDMRYSCIKRNWDSCRHIPFFNEDNWQITHKLDVMVSAKEIGPKETSPYTDYVLNDSLLSSLPYIKRLRAGNVLFNYKKYNKILAYEGTADFLCPFCLVLCASFKGLTFHLWACHDYFKFEFTVTEQYQIVNVFVDIKKWKDKIFEDPRTQTFLWLKPQRRITCQNVKDFHSIECIFGGNMGEDGYNEVHLGKDASRDSFPLPVTASTLDVDQPVDTSHREIRNDTCVVERAELVKSTANLQAYSRMRASLQKRQLFHSQGVQLMDIEEVLQDKDSEDEIDEDIANFEDRMRLDNRVGPSYLTEYEKRFMHLWNSFTRRHKVFADAHIPWACEQFLRQHGDVIIGSLQLTWCWRLFTVKLWNLGLIDGNMMDRYTSICQDIQRRLGCM